MLLLQLVPPALQVRDERVTSLQILALLGRRLDLPDGGHRLRVL